MAVPFIFQIGIPAVSFQEKKKKALTKIVSCAPSVLA